MNYDAHVRFTAYLRGINNGTVLAYTVAEDTAAALLWDTEADELDRMGVAAWKHEDELREDELKAKAAVRPVIPKRRQKKVGL